MSDDAAQGRDPFVHIVAGDEKWNVCLNFAAKWVAGIAATLIGALLLGAFHFAWQSNEALGRVLEHLDTIDLRISNVETKVEKVDDKLDGKADRQ